MVDVKKSETLNLVVTDLQGQPVRSIAGHMVVSSVAYDSATKAATLSLIPIEKMYPQIAIGDRWMRLTRPARVTRMRLAAAKARRNPS